MFLIRMLLIPIVIFSGKSDDVYVKTYDPLLSFAPNNENYVKEMDNDGQSDAYTLIAPDDNSFKKV